MKHFLIIAFLCASLAQSLWSQVALNIQGVADRTTYDGSVTFSVPSSSGYAYTTLLNGERVPTDASILVDRMDFYELYVWRTNLVDFTVTNRFVRFIVISTNRGNPEKGLIEWLPYPLTPSASEESVGATLHVIVPTSYPAGLEIPVAAWVENSPDHIRRVNGDVWAPGFVGNNIPLWRGIGSAILPGITAGSHDYSAQFGSLSDPHALNIEPATTWTTVSGMLSGAVVWPENSRIRINANLTIPSTGSLTIGAGTVVLVHPGINITNSGTTTINGTLDRPVYFVPTGHVYPEVNTYAWGGFLLRGATAILNASGTFFYGGGGASSFNFSPSTSHRSEQPVFIVQSGARLALTNSFVVNTAGQVANGYNSDVTYDHTLLQRAITCGEYVGGTIIVDHSAVVGYPDYNGAVNATIADADYDAIYFTTGTHILRDSLFGFAKDDAIDSGSGGAGTMYVTNCWVEAALHEAHAWSGEGRRATSYDTVLMNCGQGIESGWSTGTSSPLCYGERLLSTANSVGARFGDNYDWSYQGFLQLTNCLILNNYRDVFARAWNTSGSGWDTNYWTERLAQMDLRSNYLTAADSRFPSNAVWNPARDAAKLVPFMTTPTNAIVGASIASWTNALAMSQIVQGVPLRLSSFTVSPVTVSWQFVGIGGQIVTGSTVFNAGETLLRAYPSNLDVRVLDSVQFQLTGATGGELTGMTNLTFSGTLANPTAGFWGMSSPLNGGRMMEGLAVRLSSPVAADVLVDYTVDSDTGPLDHGTLTVQACQKTAWLSMPASYSTKQWVRVQLTNSATATLSGLLAVTFTNPPLVMKLSGASTQLPLYQFTNGLLLTINLPAPDGVGVDYAFEGNGRVLSSGRLQFAPGQSTVTLTAPSVNPLDFDLIKLTLSNPSIATLLEPQTVVYLKMTPPVIPANKMLVPRGSVWHFRDVASAAPSNWNTNGFNDSAWGQGKAQLGFGDGDEITQIASNKQVTTYFRAEFVVDNTATYTNLALWVLMDDGAVAYLNGLEVYRSTYLPALPTQITYSTLSGNTGDNLETNVVVSSSYLRAGTNVIAVEIHQQSTTSSDVSFDAELLAYAGPVVTGRPQLLLGRFSADAGLAWPDTTWKLEQNESLTPGQWISVTNASPYLFRMDAPQRFYRLIKTGP